MFKRIALSAAAVVAVGGAVIVPASPASAADSPYSCTTSAIYGGMVMPATNSTSPKYLCHLYPGATGQGVYELQKTLNQCFGASLETDSQFGTHTEDALKKAQTTIGVTADGNYGTNTRLHFLFMSADTPKLCIHDGGQY